MPPKKTPAPPAAPQGPPVDELVPVLVAQLNRAQKSASEQRLATAVQPSPARGKNLFDPCFDRVRTLCLIVCCALTCLMFRMHG